MTDEPILIEGRVVHKKSNALRISFQDGPGDPFAVGVQGAGDGTGSKLGVLFGFKNGGTGNHLLTFTDGRALRVASKSGAPSVFSRGDGIEIATVTRGATSMAVASGGGEILSFMPARAEAMTLETFGILVTAPGGAELGRLDVIRTVGGWSVMRALDAAEDLYIWWDRAGQPMKVPILGVRLTLSRPPTELERDVLLCVCVDIAIGLRPYIADMQ